mmetsp:Transcript_60343/g.131019  ORF Transcript_60343/g.131019 Transcript_60343/m.131019 type:complete len:154 (+) Transcript_60343:462-923(+)
MTLQFGRRDHGKDLDRTRAIAAKDGQVIWNERFTFQARHSPNTALCATLHESNTLTPDSPLGHVMLLFGDIVVGGDAELNAEVRDAQGAPVGRLVLQLSYEFEPQCPAGCSCYTKRAELLTAREDSERMERQWSGVTIAKNAKRGGAWNTYYD